MTRCLAIFFVLLITLPAKALMRGGPGPSLNTDTVEALTAESDFIFIGTPAAPAVVDRYGHVTFQLNEIETLKATASLASRFPVTAFVLRPPYTVNICPGPGARLLVFSGESWMHDYVVLDPPFTAISALAPAIHDLTLKPLRDARDVLALVRQELARDPQTTKVQRFITYPSPLTTLPDDDRLLPAARTWATSSDFRARYLAARIFEAHPDPIDVSILKSMLADPFLADYPFITSPWSAHEYAIRQVAAQALTDRGIPFVTPVTAIQRTDLYQSFPWFLLPLLWLAPSLIYAAIRFPRRAYVSARWCVRRLMSTHIKILSFTAAIFFGAAWIRSLYTADNVVVARHGVMIDATSILGFMAVQIAWDWPDESPLVHLAITPDLSETTADYGGARFRLGFWHGDYSLRENYQYPDVPYFYAFAAGSTLAYSAHFWGSFPKPKNSPAVFAMISYFDAIVISLLYPGLLLLVRGCSFLRRRWLARRAARAGLCPTCSYDLRAHAPGDRCPECGTPSPFLSPAPT